jgi:hypothetical protein
MSGGNNHYSSCTCPWCYHPSFAEINDAKPINFKAATSDTYTIPNARCPECDAPVFFYRSPYGGSVYFDELGVPWPKHPCMDTGREASVRLGTAPETQKPRQTPRWKKDGWFPITFLVFGKPDSKGVRTVVVNELLTNVAHTWEIQDAPEEMNDGPAFIRRSSSGEWEIDTPSGIYHPTELKLDPNASWRRRFRWLEHKKDKTVEKPSSDADTKL